MSAIFGMYHINEAPVDREDENYFIRALQKYPANDVRTWSNGKNVFLGCHAQWITAESIYEILPFYDHERKIAITADAIIDNREELFDLLRIDHSRRKMITDSEIILESYYKWGEDSPKYLTGDFSYMIWDERIHKLFGARDYSGSRTLYYSHLSQTFTFCTIMKPLLSLPFVHNDMNEQWIAEFLAIPGVIDTIDPYKTVYRNIMQVPPAHSISVANGRLKLSRYCNLIPTKKLLLKSDSEYVDAFREVFQNAVKTHSRSHRNVGARLSGGLDSGSVASFAARSLKEENKQLHTFSYVPVQDFVDWTPKNRIADERPFIHSIVKYVGNIDDNYLEFDGTSPFSEIDSMLELMEMPYKFFENSFWLKGIYEAASNENISVLLNGGRGNYTISWGPAIDYYAILLKKFNFFRFLQEIRKYSLNKGTGRKHVLKIVSKKAFPFRVPFKHYQADQQYSTLINPDLAKRTGIFEKLNENGIIFDTSNVSMYKFRENLFKNVYSWNLNGTSRTKLSLPYSLWDRDPTNDLRVVKFCLSLPEEQFVKNGYDRSLIRRATETYLPDSVRLNQRIRGIQGADGIHRMKTVWNHFIDEIEKITDDEITNQFLNKNIIKKSLSKFKDNPRPEFTYDSEFKVLMRSLIFYKFVKKELKGGDIR
ncbi:MAG: asparagine synthase-related protein [Heyndrickxia sp.]